MKVKKIFASLLALCLLVSSISACGDKNKTPNETEQTTDAPVDTTPVEIEDEGVNFWVENNAGFENAIEGVAEEFEVEITDGAVTILAYKGINEHLSIPAEINGMPVTSIADGAFAVVEEELPENTDENTEEKAPLLIEYTERGEYALKDGSKGTWHRTLTFAFRYENGFPLDHVELAVMRNT